METAGLFAADLLLATPRALAAGAVERQAESDPASLALFGEDAFARALEDTETRLRYLAEAAAVGRPALFEHHVEWSLETYDTHGLDLDYLRANLRALEAELEESLPPRAAQRLLPSLRAGLRRLERPPAPAPSFLRPEAPLAREVASFLVAALEGRSEDALKIVDACFDRGADPDEIGREVVGRALTEVGRLWQRGEASIADEHLVSRLAERAVARIAQRRPRAAARGRKVLTFSIGGNLHDIGVRLVADCFEAAGWQVFHLGANTPGDHLFQLLRDPGVDLLAVSATLTLHVRAVAELIAKVRADEEFRRLPILVGGTPFRVVADLHKVVGADATAASATEALAVAERLVAAPPRS